MQIVYSIGGCVFAGGGIGKTAYHTVSAIYRHRMLKQLIVVAYRPTEINRDLITTVPSRIRGLRKVVGQTWADTIQDVIHAKLSGMVMQNADIFHGWSGMSLEALRKAKNRSMLTVLTRASSHIDQAREVIVEEYRRWGLHRSAPHVIWNVRREYEEYELADLILVPSNYARDSFIHRGFDPAKVRMIPFGAQPEPDVKPREVGNALSAIFIGQVGFRKGVLYALEGWQKADIPKGKFYVVGQIEEEIKPQLAKFEADESIVFTGYTDVKPYLLKADVLVFPSLDEGSALVVYEAMAMGLPVIVTYNSGSVVVDGQEGLVVPERDSRAIQEALQSLYHDLDRYTEMSQRCLEAIKEYTWFNYGEKVVSEYNTLS